MPPASAALMTSFGSTPLALRRAGARRAKCRWISLADDLVDRAEVLLDLGDLLRDAGHEVGVGGVGRRVVVGDEVEDLRLAGLAVPVDPADALLQPRRVERDVEVDQAVAVRLQVDALAGGVGGEQHPDRFLRRDPR